MGNLWAHRGDKAIAAGGYAPSTLNVIEHTSIASTGNAADFGDCNTARYGGRGIASQTRGIIAGGYAGGNTNDTEYITISSTGNGADFGDLLSVRAAPTASSNAVKGIVCLLYTSDAADE